MNDSILFLAFSTLFGLAMLVVGWYAKEYRANNEIARVRQRNADDWGKLIDRKPPFVHFRDCPDETDAAGA